MTEPPTSFERIADTQRNLPLVLTEAERAALRAPTGATDRPLAPAALNAHVAALVANEALVPPDKTGALVTVVTAQRVQLALALRTEKGWTVDLVAQYAYGGDASVETRITKVW